MAASEGVNERAQMGVFGSAKVFLESRFIQGELLLDFILCHCHSKMMRSLLRLLVLRQSLLDSMCSEWSECVQEG